MGVPIIPPCFVQSCSSKTLINYEVEIYSQPLFYPNPKERDAIAGRSGAAHGYLNCGCHLFNVLFRDSVEIFLCVKVLGNVLHVVMIVGKGGIRNALRGFGNNELFEDFREAPSCAAIHGNFTHKIDLIPKQDFKFRDEVQCFCE